MKNMLTLASLVIGFVLCLVVSGCATASSSTQSDASLIQSVMTKLIPSDFSGPIELTHTDQYFSISIRGENVRRNSDGKWTWDWLEYDRSSHFPVFSGVQWSSTGKVRLGKSGK